MVMNKYQKESPRFDLLTGEIINFKNKEQYFASYYNNRTNLVKHFQKLDKKTIEDITKKIIEARVLSKNIKYALSTIECKSLPIPCPTPALIEFLGLDFNLISQACGLTPKYKYKEVGVLSSTLPKHIIVDSREQVALKLQTKTEVRKLSFGDYALSTDLNNALVIEKKEAKDFINTISQDFARFYRELCRAKEANAKLLILVDLSLSKILSFNYLPQFRWTKATPAFLFSRLRELIQCFDNVQAVFVDGKNKSAAMTKFALGYGPKLFNYDIQFLLDNKKILL